MPSTSKRQRKYMGAELARLRSGKKTETDMSEEELSEFAHAPLATIPRKKKKKK